MRKQILYWVLPIFILTSSIFLYKSQLAFTQSTALEKLKEKKEGEEPSKGEKKEKKKKQKSTKEGIEALRKIFEKKISSPTPIIKETVPVMAFKVKEIKNFKEILPILGTITAFEEIKLAFPERGVIKNLYVEEGATVEKGELLGELKEKEFELKKEFAQSKHEAEYKLLLSMKKEYSIKKALFDQGAILKEKLEELALKIESQQAKTDAAGKEIELAEESLKRIKLYSPVHGKINKKEAEEGEFVSPENKVFNIVKIDKVFAEVGITERDIPKIKSGQVAQIKVDAYPEDTFEGRITSLGTSIIGASRTLTVKIEIANKRYGYRLYPGMFLRGSIILNSTENALVVPTDSLIKNLSDYSILVIQLEKTFTEEEMQTGEVKGKVVLRKVIPITEGIEYSPVLGLEEGEFVVIRSHGEITPNCTGRIINVEEYVEP